MMALLTVTIQRHAHAQNEPSFAGEPRDAERIFATTCGWCHSKGGREAGKGPKLASITLSDGQILFRIKRGRQGFMLGYEGTFSEAELNGLLVYIRNLKP
jgi:mono/diheme cytochrome c family protein